MVSSELILQPTPARAKWLGFGSRGLRSLGARAIDWAALGIGLVSLIAAAGVQAQSQLLESVKQNPALAKQICAQLRQMNSNGITSTSSQAIQTIAQQRQLSSSDAEVLTTYVVGLYCPDVR